MEFIDQLNRSISLKTIPSRIISLVPSQTELLVDLGLRGSIVGITKFCVHPKDLKSEKVIVGGTKSVDFSKIKSLRPDIIICNKEENTQEMVYELGSISPVYITDIKTLTDTIAMIGQLGKIFNVCSKASEIISKINTIVNEHRQFIQSVEKKKVLYLIWKKPFMAAGKDTFIDSLLRENNFENVFTKASGRYPEVREGDFEKTDLILISTEPYPFKENDAIFLKNKFKKKVILVDGEYFSWYGSRILNSFKYFKKIHGEK